MESSVELIAGFPTSVLRRTPAAAALDCAAPWLVVIPGNPGVVDFYTEFVDHLFELHGGRLAVCAVGHAGHAAHAHAHSWFFAAQICTLEQQIAHKAAFLRGCPAGVSFVLLGHSVGSYISLQLLKRFPELRIRCVLNLMPTIHDIAPGMKPAVRWLILPVLRHVLALLAHFAPRWLRNRLLAVYETNLREQDKRRAQALMCYGAVLNILCMAHDEARSIRELDETLIAPVRERLVFLFAQHDRYTPLESHCHALRRRFPDLHVHIADDAAIPHAFVQGHALAVAQLCAQFLATRRTLVESPAAH